MKPAALFVVLALTLAAPVVVWGALPFHRAAWANARHAAATMDTLMMGNLRFSPKRSSSSRRCVRFWLRM